MPKTPYLSVVIPAYDEEQNIRHGMLDDVYSFLAAQSYSSELIVIDDGSNDSTGILLNQYARGKKNIHIINAGHHGKAGAVITGILAATGEVILFTDFDQATPIAEIVKLLPHFKKYSIVIGSRYTQRRGAPLSRLVMARGFVLLRRLLLGLSINDTQCGFKAFRRDAAYDLFNQLAEYRNRKEVKGSSVSADFDVELLYLAAKRGYRIKEVPVAWHYVETRRVNSFRDSWEGLIGLLRIKINEMRGTYGQRA